MEKKWRNFLRKSLKNKYASKWLQNQRDNLLLALPHWLTGWQTVRWLSILFCSVAFRLQTLNMLVKPILIPFPWVKKSLMANKSGHMSVFSSEPKKIVIKRFYFFRIRNVCNIFFVCSLLIYSNCFT